MKPLDAFLALLALAGTLLGPRAGGEELLQPEQAFKVSARQISAGSIEVRYDIAPGHYLYRDRLRFVVNGRSLDGSKIGFPVGQTKVDPTFGKVVTFEGKVQIRLKSGAADQDGSFLLALTSQGCAAKAGVCYPPHAQTIRLPRNSTAWETPADVPQAPAGSALNRLTAK